jgi:mono/diheme cytochrome c family protein
MLAGLTLLAAALADHAPAAGQPASSGDAKPDQAAVDRSILNGYRRYSATCSHCHGADGLGSTFAPPLIARPLPFEQFAEIVNNGRAGGNSVMRGLRRRPERRALHRRHLQLSAGARRGHGRSWPAGSRALSAAPAATSARQLLGCDLICG